MSIRNASYTTFIGIFGEKRDIHITSPFRSFIVKKFNLFDLRTKVFFSCETTLIFMQNGLTYVK